MQGLAVPQDRERVRAQAVAARLDHGQRHGGRDRSVDRIAALGQHRQPRLRRQRLRGRHHVGRQHGRALRRIGQRHVEAGLDGRGHRRDTYIGGTRPSLPTVMRDAVRLPSGILGGAQEHVVAGLEQRGVARRQRHDRRAGRHRPAPAAVLVGQGQHATGGIGHRASTVALVIVLSGVRSQARWPSPAPRIASGKISTSCAFSVPSGCGTAAVPMKLPVAAAARSAGTSAAILTSGVRVSSTVGPSRVAIVSAGPLACSMVPRIRSVSAA